jgi:uncharacterized protein (DUF1800 family)
MSMLAQQFSRRVGFGLGVNDQAPADPVNWASQQAAQVPPLFFKAKLPTTAEALKNRKDYLSKRTKMRARLAKKPKEYADQFLKLIQETKISTVSWEYHARGYAGANGPTPVFERLWHFWCNHFTLSAVGNELAFLIGPCYREAIRPKLGGSFADLLYAVTVHAAMLEYLDNIRSIGPHSRFAKQLGRHPRAKARGLNENHARELLELHTVSSAAGYSQKDVIELALIMTGWFEGRFVAERHEPGTRHFFGKTYRDKGAGSLREAIDDIAAMPQTAKFLSRKLAIAFIADSPPQEAVDHIVAAWTASGGRLPDVHHALFEAVNRWGGEYEKFLPPEAWFIQCARILNSPVFIQPGETFYGGDNYRWLFGWYRELGQNTFYADQPNGWSYLKANWVSPEMIDRRVRFGVVFLQALHKSNRLTKSYLKDVALRNWPGRGRDVLTLFAGASSAAERFQRLCASPLIVRC